ncbi:hypothetical protein BDZ88DRAFT_426958 [Geranomyces variabilis]|nr:hypothetical protein BDZ88DRAFT_426958 [Geranomyces variabilis]
MRLATLAAGFATAATIVSAQDNTSPGPESCPSWDITGLSILKQCNEKATTPIADQKAANAVLEQAAACGCKYFGGNSFSMIIEQCTSVPVAQTAAQALKAACEAKKYAVAATVSKNSIVQNGVVRIECGFCCCCMPWAACFWILTVASFFWKIRLGRGRLFLTARRLLHPPSARLPLQLPPTLRLQRMLRSLLTLPLPPTPLSQPTRPSPPTLTLFPLALTPRFLLRPSRPAPPRLTCRLGLTPLFLLRLSRPASPRSARRVVTAAALYASESSAEACPLSTLRSEKKVEKKGV